MDLTSLRRVKFALGIAKADEDRILSGLVGAASRQIAAWLRRLDQSGGDAIEYKSRTEYLDPVAGERVIYPRAYPIASVTSLYGDSTGKYSGDEAQVDSDDYIIASDYRAVVLTASPDLPEWYTTLPVTPKGARLVYTAGLAADPVISAWTKGSDSGGTLAAGNYVRGETSGSVARIYARAAGTISLEVLAGYFVDGETLTEYARLDTSAEGGMTGVTGVSAVLTTCTARCLAEAHPAIVEACEMQVQFLRKNRGRFDDLTAVQDGVTKFSRADLKTKYGLMPEIEEMLRPYRNNLVRV